MGRFLLFPLLLVSFSQLLTMLIWFNYSAILPLVKQEWQLTSAQAGVILSSFQFGYLISALILGYLSDRWKPRLIFVWSAVVAGLGGLLFGLAASGFWSGLVFRVIAGIGLGGIYVPGLKYLSGLYPPETRGKTFGIYVGALVVGSGGSLLIASPLIALFGWREVVMITSVGAFLAALVMALYRVDPPLPGQPPKLSKKLLAAMLSNRKLVAMNVAYAGHMWELYAFWGWVGPFMVFAATAHGFSSEAAQQIGNFWAGMFVVVGAFGTWLGGELSDRIGRVAALKPLLIVGLGCSLVFGWLPNSLFFVLIICGLVYGITVVGDSPVYSVAISEYSPPGTVGLALGIQQVIGYSITVVSPGVFGYMLEVIPHETIAWGAAFAMLALGSFTSLLVLPKEKKQKKVAPL